MSHSGIHLNLSANSPEAMRELFEQCMAETDKLHYDGKLIHGNQGGAGQVYVFGEDCPDCKARHWIGARNCTTCNGIKQVGPAWVMP
ncbi:hypothetical protein JRC04_05075 [Mycolicibacterium sp. S2-37]|uniref:hypothetical protein n=1 Tax=Mycolicibacterium sp. S2-37 TaxID=2810297 RepID=UPI001A93F1CD|nr:hypothetical protein [Mycolicibacterium sp. S2-37]MBO0676830.1 hypothetical protein [Mycolicibacterium sp. S2-37]